MMQVQPNRIHETIERFQEAQELNLPQLMDDARFLAAQMYPFAEAVGLAKRLYNEAHVQRRMKLVELREQIKQGQKVSSAEAERQAEATAQFREAYQKEYTLEAKYEKGKIMLRAMQEIHSRMSQEIAELRYEKRHYEAEQEAFTSGRMPSMEHG